MRSFSKKLAFVLAAAMVVTVVTPAAQAKAADDFTLNRTEQTLYVNKGVNDKGVVGGGLYGNVQMYDFNLKNKPSDWKDYGYKWTSSNTKVATVVSGGITTAVGVGTATISCVITDKATGEIANTLKAKVTVKANAKDVILVDKEKRDGTIVEVGDVVDLDRTLVDENGNKSGVRGKYVTDLTKWVAEPNKGVEINQSNGQYTFTEEAVAGDYKLYCYTYQSSKYSQPTATSESVTVTLADASFEVKQDTLTKFTMNFGAPVKALTAADVEVIRLLEAGSNVYEYPQVVKSVKLADNGLSATVEMFESSPFQNNVNYVIKVKGFDDYTMTASAGVPVSMTISSNADVVSPFVTAGSPAQLYYKLYDANNVDVTTGRETVLFSSESFSTDGSYYVAGDKIWFKDPGASAVVLAEYQSNKYENGVQVGNVPAKFVFHSVSATPVTLKGVTDATVNGWGNGKSLSVPLGTTDAKLEVKVATSNGGNPELIDSNRKPLTSMPNAWITFEETTPNILAIDKDTMKLKTFQQGTATVIVNLETRNSENQPVFTPVGVVTITVTAPSALSTVTVDKPLVTVGTETGYTEEKVMLTLKDQYGGNVVLQNVAITGVNDTSNAVVSGVQWMPGTNEIRLYGDTLKAAIPAGSNAIQLTFRVKVNWSKEITLAVLVKNQTNNPDADYNSIEITDGKFGDVARTLDSKDAKSVTFTVFQMNNGIKIGQRTLEKYPGNVQSDAVQDHYYFKVVKNGEDITNATDENGAPLVELVSAGSGSAVKINFSSTKRITNGAVTGSVVSYDKVGAGNYVFTLYKCIVSTGGMKILVQQQQPTTGTVTCNTGSYSPAVKIKDYVEFPNVTPEAVRACFDIKNVKNQGASPVYYVDMDAATDHVYVKSITFYDELGEGSGVYASYTVNIGTSLRINRPVQ